MNFVTFSKALDAVKNGVRCRRLNWHSDDMFIFLVQGSKFVVNRAPLLGLFPEGTEINYHGHIDMRTSDNTIVPWTPTQEDILANDWIIAE